jgi:asparagine synthase (glutamine-hydrolysing)
MCGIVGFMDRNSRMSAGEVRATIQRMANSLRHRGPEDQGCWIDSRLGLALGHRRLSIIDLSSAGHQPMISSCGRYVLILNGEIYNFRELRKDLEREAEKFRGHSDTEVMLVAIRRWGLERAIQRFNGMFAFALWDSQEGLLYLGRDRAGEKPLYYGWAGQSLLFASELKALRCHPHFPGEIDRDVLALFLRHNFVPGPHSIYKGIRKLPPGTLLTIRAADGTCSLKPYWSLRQQAEQGLAYPFCGTEADAISELDSLLRDAVKLRMESDVPLGAFLSGGVDSSLVVALMQANSRRPVQTFTIGFPNREYDEAPFARDVAQHLGTEHTDLYVTEKEMLDVVPHLPTIYDEPFADSSQIPTFLVSKLARSAVTVSLSGDGGDELFGGYDRYIRGQRIFNQLGKIPKALKGSAAKALACMTRAADGGPLHEKEFKLFSRLSSKNIGGKLQKLACMLKAANAESFHWILASYWTSPAALVPGAREPERAFTDPAQWSHFTDLRETMMFLDTMVYLPDDILVKVDRASMAVSLEARVPLLDHRVIEFAWRLPLFMKIDRNGGKKLLRQLLRKYLPASLVDRPKKGFAVPLEQWLCGPLRPWAEHLLDEARLQDDGYLEKDAISRRWRAYKRGQSESARSLWGVLMFQAWLDEQKQAPSVPARSHPVVLDLPAKSSAAV